MIEKPDNKNLDLLLPFAKKKIYSQCGEEGIIDAILNIDTILRGKPIRKYLVDLGAGGGFSNTLYFLENGWDGIRVDGDNGGDTSPLTLLSILEHFITAENIVEFLTFCDVPVSFGLLSIDLDGNDIYILDTILTEGYRPKLICCEFNPVIKGSKAIAYNESHVWNNDDYYGFSFAAGKKLAKKHGYKVVYQNDGLNMYLLDANYDVEEIDYEYKGEPPHKHNDVGIWVDY